MLKSSSAATEVDAAAPTIATTRAQLGRLDGVLGGLTNIPKVRQIKDPKKIAAILLETNIVELQRHLLTITVQNQVSESLGKFPAHQA